MFLNPVSDPSSIFFYLLLLTPFAKLHAGFANKQNKTTTAVPVAFGDQIK